MTAVIRFNVQLTYLWLDVWLQTTPYMVAKRFSCAAALRAGAVKWPLLPDSDTFRCFVYDFGFRDQMAAWKSTTSQKGHTLITRLSQSIMEPVFISKPYFEYMVQCEFTM